MSFLNKRIQFMRPRANKRFPSNYPTDGCGIPLRITRYFPMKLKEVTLETLQEKKQGSEPVCMHEMMSLFECFERNDFDKKLCQQQATALENCFSANARKKVINKTRK